MANYIAMLAGQANKEITFNDLAFNLSPAAIFGINQNNTAGLSVCLFGGKLTKDIKFDDLIYLTLTANATNYVSANVSTKQVTVSTVEFDGVPLWKFITNANSITNLNTADERAHSLFTPDSSIVLATNVVAGLVKTSPTVFLDLNNQLDVAIDDVTIKKDAEGKLYSVGGGGSGGGTGLTYLEEDKTSLANTILLKPNESNTELSLSTGLITKGNGSFIVSYSSMLGNSRGSNCVDIQPYRTLATQVSAGRAVSVGSELTSGLYAVNLGYKNKATGFSSDTYGGIVVGQESEANIKSIALGYQAIASNANVSIAVGQKVTASGAWSFAVGESVTASANGSVAIGRYSASNGQYCLVYGFGGNSHSQNGGLVLGNNFSSTATSADGNAQMRLNCYYATLNKSTLSRALTTNGNSTPSFANQLSLVNYQRRLVKILVQMSEDKATGAEACFEITAYIKRGNGAATTELLTSTITPIYISDLATTNGYAVSISANTSIGCLSIVCSANATTSTSSLDTIKCQATTIDNQIIISG